ncbi:outer membrane efflux protein (plasmid) [Gemmatirosa kalamazoonensis]|uniref:Outer membrane efflux protein n=1 Tax=Gemmatirosa kalamazoonensis TaxID=861299 RepID=W0RT63_9BACT|nr:TolC family protein [Gemmatirosa kalamazoonensis]AHG93662.1 outer membrane efflux protein [Gemmatirosa kalamazoonensis]
MTETHTPGASWHERQRGLRETAILDAAAALMAEHGYAATSVDDIAAHVGVSKPTLYQHFPSKDAIAQAVLVRNLSRAEERLAAAEADIAAGERARARLERHLRDAIGVHNALWGTRAQLPGALRDAPALRKRRERVWARYGRMIDTCKAEGDCRTDVPTALLVRHIVRVFRGDYADLIADGTVTLEALAEILVSLLFDGMAPRAAPRPTSRKRTVPRRALALAALSLVAHAVLLDAQPTTPASTRPLTLADVVDAALRANPTARAAAAEARVAAEQYAAARGSWLPTLTFAPSFVAAQSASSGGGAGGGAPSLGGAQRVTFGPSVNLSYLLFDVGGRAGTVGAARETASVLSLTRDATVQQTLLQAEQAYFGYQAARALSDAQEANVRTATASRDAAVGRYHAGLATVADTLQTATALAQARVAAVSARTGLAAARATLATAMGARADTPFAVAIEPAPDADATRAATAALTANVDSLVAHALRERPDVSAAGANAAVAGERVRVARSALLPSVQVGASAGHVVANQANLAGQSYNVQLGLALPLFDGGARHADLDAARAEQEAAQLRAEAVRTGVVNQVVASADALRLAGDQVATSAALLASAVSSEEVARGRYTEGVGSVVDLVTAQGALATARAQAAQSRWGWASALAELSRDAGILGAAGELPAVAAPAVPPTTRPGAAAPTIIPSSSR